MTALVEPSTERLYHSDRGLYPFQAEGVAYCYERPDNLPIWDCGIGKSHLAMATSAMLFEDGLVDHVLVVCEKNKIDEWLADLAKFTSLTAVKYLGDPARRAKVRAALPQVLVTTYETARNDIGKWTVVPGRKTKKLLPSVLVEALTGRRVLVVYDEITKLGNRGSDLHKAHDLLVSSLRKAAPTRTLGLTATPIERDVENVFNIGRILTPATMPTVGRFETDYVKGRDIFGKATGFKNLTAADLEDPGVVPFKRLLAPVLLRKRKTDPDVIDQFPKTVEEISYVPLAARHREFYDTVLDTFNEGREADEVVPGLWTTMRMIAAHPGSLVGSQGQISRAIVDQVGPAGLAALGSAKMDWLVKYLEPLVLGQGAQAVVFSFFGPTVLPLLAGALDEAGISCAMNHGYMTDRDRSEQKEDFRAGRYQVFLTSDAGARGINLPEATYAVEFEMAMTHANRTQRLNRIHRIDSTAPSVTFQTLVAHDTVEENIARGVLSRNAWSDTLLDDDDPGEHFMSAADRRQMLVRARRAMG